jgi:5-methylcytosine-specific restriction endonuclease McrA
MDTLVLSQSFEPVARIPWQRAITLLWENKVEIVEEYEDWTVRSVTLEFKVPSVIRFLKRIIGKKRAIKFSRENVYTRDQGRCQYCHSKVPRQESTYDHVVPRAHGGQTRWENIVIACVPCNQKKGGRTPEQAGMKLFSTPVRPKKLPDTMRLTFTFRKGMPESWKNWLRDVSYWNGELESD